ncbi:MAG: hypothetical protein A3F72_20340 [Bacteroidetes bacterium RIFCSPLOWO2_12_FULL_35_15]|nr:MAG: hypothetical protein A3F72_20340 [Bacteroidetes bacterium RIFCSPLOWO2_12_FULL_35_15]
MIEFRKELIEKILQSPNEKEIESNINDSINRMIENGTNMHIIKRFEDKLESDLKFEISEPHTEKEFSNIKGALRVMKEITLKNNSVIQ